MSDDEPVTAAGKASVGDQGHLRSEPHAGNGARGTEHLAHARTSAGAFAADDDDLPAPDTARENRLGRPLFSFEHARAAFEAYPLLAGDLGDGALGRQVPVEHHQMTVLLQWVRERADK